MLCLPKQVKDVFIKGLKDGTLDPVKLADIKGSEARRAALEPFVGKEYAASVNALFESKLLLKNQNNAMISWIKSVAGLKPQIKNALIDKVNKLDGVLTPEDRSAFFKDLASQKLGTEITVDQAGVISKLADEFNAAKADPNSGLRYGTAEVALNNYVNDIKLANQKQSLPEVLGLLKKDPISTAGRMISDLAGAAKGIKASLDNSAIFRQGWKTLFTNPKIWADNAAQSFKDIAKQLGKSADDSSVIDGIKAEIQSRPAARSGLYKTMKLDIGNLEEAFPSSLPEKIPLFNRLYKASETAYTGFLYRMRADIADKMIRVATEGGIDVTNKAQAESIGKLVNSLTGRGSLGSFEKVGKEINTIFFSPKMLKANLDFLTAHVFDAKVSKFAKIEAGKNLITVIGGIATIMGIAEALSPGSVETDPRSADFGKIRVGDTRFDISGGMSSIVTLAARILKSSTKSSTTGKVTKLNTGKFGSKTTLDVIESFGENKLSPFASVVKNLLNGTDFNGKPITLGGEAKNLLVPLPITNAEEVLTNPDAANPLLTIIADALGISTNTY